LVEERAFAHPELAAGAAGRTLPIAPGARRPRPTTTSPAPAPAPALLPLGRCCYCPPLVDRTLVIVKPDGVERGLIGEIVSRLERKNLRLVAAEMRTITTELAQAHYAEHAERPFFADLVQFITRSPVLAMVV
jgi:Nucleoside diphosphate kinase